MAMGNGCENDPEAVLEAAGVAARELSVQISILNAKLIEAASVIKANEGHLAGTSAAWWLSMQAGLTTAESERIVKATSVASACPLLFDALSAGKISVGLLTTLAKVATTDNQAELVASCETATHRQIEHLVRDMARVQRDNDPESAEPKDTVRAGFSRDGRWRAAMNLNPELGARAEKVFNAAFDKLMREHEGEGCDDPATVTAGQIVPAAGAVDSVDAFLEIVNQYLFGLAGDRNRLPDTHQIIVHCDLNAFMAANGIDLDEAANAWIEGGGSIDPNRLPALLASSSIRFLLFNAKADPVFLTKASRLATEPQLRALWARDHCCQWPGCGRTKKLRAHHITFWSNGGRTVLTNLILVCGHHHRLIHTQGWQLERNPDTGVVTLHHPAGHQFDPDQRRWIPPPDPPPDLRQRRHAGTGEPATNFARSVLLERWLTATKPAA